MGLFDFLKSKQNEKSIAVQTEIKNQECDINKTAILDGLFAIPIESRDEKWRKSFLDNLPNASFADHNPQTFVGPDGFPYFILKMPQENVPFDSFCIQNMIDYLLKDGLGIAINPRPNKADWIFSYGDLLNFKLNQEFYSTQDNVEIKRTEVLERKEEVLVAQPSESYLPGFARKNIREFLISLGISKPKLQMVWRKIQGTVVMELVFNVFAEDFPDEESLNLLLHKISWYLPRHYVLLVLPKEKEFLDGFMDL